MIGLRGPTFALSNKSILSPFSFPFIALLTGNCVSLFGEIDPRRPSVLIDSYFWLIPHTFRCP